VLAHVAAQSVHSLLLFTYADMVQIDFNVCSSDTTKLYCAGLANQLHAAHRLQKYAEPGALPGSCYQVHSASRAGHRGRQAVQSAGVVLTLHSLLYSYAGLLKGLQEEYSCCASQSMSQVSCRSAVAQSPAFRVHVMLSKQSRKSVALCRK
jgi:hypothetical protein